SVMLPNKSIVSRTYGSACITLAIVGIGAVEPSELLARSGNIFSSRELSDLAEAGAVGDISLRFFDKNGKPVKTPLDD
ncbi:sugar-binding domain-containing protein, partial [Rhizobium leguminosarum]|uniref:sugar-binding domain-containing protein n=1 Tax=Rhizobium leguminosarum TaxID=384 RepID=UPI003F963B7A